MLVTDEWLAGFFDGEGCFWLGSQVKKSTGKRYPACRVIIGQSGENGKEVLEAIQTKHGGELYQHLAPGQHKATKSAYKLYWNAEEALALINTLLPHLLLKKEEAMEVKEYLERKKDGKK